MPVPDFSPGEVLTAAAMDSIGLWKIASVSVTSGSVLSVSNCFTSDYDNYRIVVSNLKSTGNAALSMQLEASGTPSATGYTLVQAFMLLGNASWFFNNPATATAWAAPGNTNTNPPASGTIDIFQPQKAERTGMVGHYQSWDAGIFTTGSHDAGTNVYDGFRFISAGTFTSGTATVYGYRK